MILWCISAVLPGITSFSGKQRKCSQESGQPFNLDVDIVFRNGCLMACNPEPPCTAKMTEKSSAESTHLCYSSDFWALNTYFETCVLSPYLILVFQL